MKQQCQYLVVDDDSSNNLICDFTIRRFDANAVINLFTSPEEGLGFIQNKRNNHPKAGITVLFLDVNMPTMTGFQFLREFRKISGGIKEQFRIYILSSSIEDYSSQAVEFPEIQGFLSKPLNLQYLKDIEDALQNSSNEDKK